jgi:hypothetical protein
VAVYQRRDGWEVVAMLDSPLAGDGRLWLSGSGGIPVPPAAIVDWLLVRPAVAGGRTYSEPKAFPAPETLAA